VGLKSLAPHPYNSAGVVAVLDGPGGGARSNGKIMRRLLRDIAEGRALGDTTTLADPNVVAARKRKYEEE
jgi:hypothetical protein